MSFTRDDGWTVVRYGRGRRRSPQRDRQRADYGGHQHRSTFDRRGGGRGYRGKDRAPPVPHFAGGQVQFPYPNQPVPPLARPRPPPSFSSDRYRGPHCRSYASVVGQTNPNTSRGIFTTGFRGPFDNQHRERPGGGFSADRNRATESTDPKFGQLTRKLHKVIKMVHHLQNVTPEPEKPEPLMISRMVNTLASMIKPAAPTPDTMDLIVGNAKNWGYNTLVILEDHYRAGLDAILKDLSQDLIPEWKTAFGVAIKWARRNLPRIKQEVIDHAEALITACGHSDQDLEPQEPSPPQHITTEQRVPQQPPSQHTTIAQRQTPQHSPPESMDAEHQQIPQQTLQRTTVEPTESPQQRGAEGEDRGIQITIQSSQPDSPKEQRPRGNARSPIREATQDNGLDSNIGDGQLVQLGVGDSPQAQRPNGGDSLLEEDLGLCGDGTPTLHPVQSTTPVGLGNTSTPQFHLYKVKRHITTDRKMVDWGLNVSKKWLIIGDSNLSRIPMYSIPDLQIESYPGANFRHAQSILSKTSGLVAVEKLVLSFGLNCRGQKAKETAVKQLQTAVREAKKQFPFSEIWVPLINFSPSLPREQKVNLQILNNHITKNLPFIPELPASDFETERDQIHWTRDTARAMLHHWLDCLNLRSP